MFKDSSGEAVLTFDLSRKFSFTELCIPKDIIIQGNLQDLKRVGRMEQSRTFFNQ
jgi:hypothetical protein